MFLRHHSLGASVSPRCRARCSRDRTAGAAATRARRKKSRRGATMVETAIIMTVFIALTLGAVDLQIGVYRYNTLSEAARHGARQAMVHGAMAPPALPLWGPGTYAGTAADGSEYASAVRPLLVGFPYDAVTLRVEWIDGSTAVGKRVRYTLTTQYSPLLGALVGYPTMTLQAASTMRIAH